MITGRWIWDENAVDWRMGGWRCNRCHARNGNIGGTAKTDPFIFTGSAYCPNCGARMTR